MLKPSRQRPVEDGFFFLVYDDCDDDEPTNEELYIGVRPSGEAKV